MPALRSSYTPDECVLHRRKWRCHAHPGVWWIMVMKSSFPALLGGRSKDIIQYAGGKVVWSRAKRKRLPHYREDDFEAAITPKTERPYPDTPSNPSGAALPGDLEGHFRLAHKRHLCAAR